MEAPSNHVFSAGSITFPPGIILHLPGWCTGGGCYCFASVCWLLPGNSNFISSSICAWKYYNRFVWVSLTFGNTLQMTSRFFTYFILLRRIKLKFNFCTHFFAGSKCRFSFSEEAFDHLLPPLVQWKLFLWMWMDVALKFQWIVKIAIR